VEQKIVEVPENEVAVALRQPKSWTARSVDLEEDAAVHQQGEKLDAREVVPLAELLDLLGQGERGECGHNLRVANPEQGAGARRLQHNVVAATPQVREPRQDENVCGAELRRSRPIIGDLWLDDDPILAVSRSAETVLQQTMASQSPDQSIDLFREAPVAEHKRGERQTRAELLRTLRHCTAERPQPDRMAVKAGVERPVRAGFERDMTADPDVNGRPCRPWPSL
jgi:hypothetical protein